MVNKNYTGIGSRKTPENILTMMTKTATLLCRQGYTLRSGGAAGADSAFEAGVYNHKKEIYLPYKNFNGNKSTLYNLDNYDEARKIAKKYHPAWHVLTTSGKQFHTRNVYQILGADLESPTDFVVCWTSDGKASGGTGQALRIAKSLAIPIYNLYIEGDRFVLQMKIADGWD